MKIPLTVCNVWDKINLYTNVGGILAPFFSRLWEVIICPS